MLFVLKRKRCPLQINSTSTEIDQEPQNLCLFDPIYHLQSNTELYRW